MLAAIPRSNIGYRFRDSLRQRERPVDPNPTVSHRATSTTFNCDLHMDPKITPTVGAGFTACLTIHEGRKQEVKIWSGSSYEREAP